MLHAGPDCSTADIHKVSSTAFYVRYCCCFSVCHPSLTHVSQQAHTTPPPPNPHLLLARPTACIHHRRHIAAGSSGGGCRRRRGALPCSCSSVCLKQEECIFRPLLGRGQQGTAVAYIPSSISQP
jgi:hypothetical protein